MIELLQFTPACGLMNLSPFCMKVEVFLKLSGLPYRCASVAPLSSPTRKLPAVREGAALVADSGAILAYLQREHAARLSPALLRPDEGPDLILRRTLEEHLYFVMLWHRWMTDRGFEISRQAFFGSLPAGARKAVAALVRRKIRRDLVGQGLGRHAPDEIAARGCADLDAAAAMLGDRPFFGGREPSALDASAYAFLANILWVPLDTPLRERVARRPELVHYCERMRERVGK